MLPFFKNKKVLLILIIFLSTLALFLIWKFKSKNTSQVIIAQVGEEKIYLNDFLEKYYEFKKEYSKTSLKNPKTRKLVKDLALKPLINQKILFLSASKTYPNLNKTLSQEDLIKKFIQDEIQSKIKVSDEEINSYFSSHYSEKIAPQRIKLQHIFVKDASLAQKIQSFLKNRPNQFTSRAHKYSHSPEAENGGYLPWMSRIEALPEFVPLFNLEKEAVSPVIKTSYGYHVFKLIDTKPEGTITLEEKSKEILEILRLEKERQLFNEKIKIFANSLEIYKNTKLLRQIP
ncbi:MAG: peptidylprolyl isomerase [Deltaproteobacteria bacterium]|nr:peptidylprolyl isomerase [Deltaproteobacteria bacterium]